jgi:hypothetical protein
MSPVSHRRSTLDLPPDGPSGAAPAPRVDFSPPGTAPVAALQAWRALSRLHLEVLVADLDQAALLQQPPAARAALLGFMASVRRALRPLAVQAPTSAAVSRQNAVEAERWDAAAGDALIEAGGEADPVLRFAQAWLRSLDDAAAAGRAALYAR